VGVKRRLHPRPGRRPVWPDFTDLGGGEVGGGIADIDQSKKMGNFFFALTPIYKFIDFRRDYGIFFAYLCRFLN
jgi:hypothetical protein